MQQSEVSMRKDAKRENQNSPLEMLTELVLEGSSSVVEVQRTVLNLLQQENDIVLNGLKNQVADFLPAVATTDFVRRSIDTLIEMQQEILSISNKQALQWFESGRAGKIDCGAHTFDFARDEVDAFVNAHRKLLD